MCQHGRGYRDHELNDRIEAILSDTLTNYYDNNHNHRRNACYNDYIHIEVVITLLFQILTKMSIRSGQPRRAIRKRIMDESERELE